MENKSNEVKLSVNELRELGNKLTELMYQIDMHNIAIEGLEHAQRNDEMTFLWIVKNYLTTTYELNKNLSRNLDHIACYLLNVNDKKELEAMKNE